MTPRCHGGCGRFIPVEFNVPPYLCNPCLDHAFWTFMAEGYLDERVDG